MSAISNIMNDVQLRESLIELKKEKINPDNLELKDKLVSLLQHEDPKVRKNTAVILGQYNDMIAVLLQAYMAEGTEYVKEAYLKGIETQDGIELFIDILKTIQQDLMNSDGEVKHIQAQLKILNMIIINNTEHTVKRIKETHLPVDVLLTTFPNYQFVLENNLKNYPHKVVSQGILVKTESIKEIRKIKNYKELLIPVGASLVEMNSTSIINALKESKLFKILERLYDEEVYYFRMVDGLREKDSQLIKTVASKLTEAYPTQLLNVNEKFDFDILLKEVKKGTVSVYIKLNQKDIRYRYRKEVIPTSMHPYTASVLISLFKPFMKESSKVYDPFCGVGTLLIERGKAKKTSFMIGTDIYKDGIEAAKRNTSNTKLTINYVHKDALRFETEELFDEIITDLPTLAQSKDEASLSKIYKGFFNRIPELLNKDSYLGIYTLEVKEVLAQLKAHPELSLTAVYPIKRGKNVFYFFIIKY